NMSHELRTPLNAIIGFSEVLRDQYFGELNEKQTEYINDILGSGRHLLSLINDILDLSKVEAGKMEFELSTVNITEMLENSLVMIKEKAHKHGIRLDLKVPNELSDLEIQADERKLKQVIFNLLSNAAKFTPDGGEIHVFANRVSSFQYPVSDGHETRNLELVEDPAMGGETGDFLQISVEDTGIGIAPEDQKKIFDEFYQVKGGVTDKTQGTGLGLSLTRRLVEMHGGRIWVESEGEGKGSRFIFSLPIK
ncbi:MAG: HAMP domain-containing sensor histidine kinase, partial [Pseudomonadota bacterium]